MIGREAQGDRSRWFRWIDFGRTAADISAARRRSGEEVVVTDDHKRLLGRISFELYPNGGDYVYMGVDGKRPFGNSSNLTDVAEVLGWEVDQEEGLSDEQKTEAVRLMSELPDVLNIIISELPAQTES